MAKISITGLAVFALCAVLWPGELQAKTFYTKKSGVKVTSDSSPKSKTVAKLQKGVAVDVQGKSGRYFKVRMKNGTTGWIYRFKLSKKKPKKRSNSSGMLSSLGGGSNVSVHEASSGGSIRGMQPASKAYAKNRHISNSHIQALSWMQKFSVEKQDLLSFQKRGKTGEFSGERL